MLEKPGNKCFLCAVGRACISSAKAEEAYHPRLTTIFLATDSMRTKAQTALPDFKWLMIDDDVLPGIELAAGEIEQARRAAVIQSSSQIQVSCLEQSF